LLDSEIEKLQKVKGATLVNCLNTALGTLGINEDDSACIADVRTMDLINTYTFYKNSPEKAFNPLTQIWFDAYNILTKTEPRLF
jgi:hypothetical protein